MAGVKGKSGGARRGVNYEAIKTRQDNNMANFVTDYDYQKRLSDIEEKVSNARDRLLAEIINKTGLSKKDIIYILEDAPSLFPESLHNLLGEFNRAFSGIKAAKALPAPNEQLLLRLENYAILKE